MHDQNVLCIIPARGGSKGVPRKNIRLLNGKPLLWHTFQAAKKAKLIDRLILSTDDEEMANYGREQGIEVPFMRPVELAQDDTPTFPVILHAVNMLEAEGYFPSHIIFLQATAPLRQAHHIDNALYRLLNSDADSIISVCRVPGHFNPYWCFKVNEKDELGFFMPDGPLKYPRRQILPPVYTRNGAIYAFRREVLLQDNYYGTKTLAYVMSEQESINIDSELDLIIAESILK